MATSRYLEQIALDLIEFREFGKYVMLLLITIVAEFGVELLKNQKMKFIRELCKKEITGRNVTDNKIEFVNYAEIWR